MSDYQLNAQYLKSQVVRDRNQGGLIAWSAYVCAQDIPTTQPDPAWVKERIVAEQIPLQSAIYVEQTLSYFLQDPATVDNVRNYLNGFNDEATEADLSDQVQRVIGTFMPRYCAFTITDAMVENWLNNNGFPQPPPQPPALTEAEPTQAPPRTRSR